MNRYLPLFLLFILLLSGLLSPALAKESSLTLGTRNIALTHNFSQKVRGRVYIYQEEFGQPLEQGLELNWSPKANNDFLFKVSKLSKDNLLDKSTLLKVEWERQKELLKDRVDYKSNNGLAYLSLPSIFSAGTDYNPVSIKGWALYDTGRWSNANPIFLDKGQKTGMNLRFGLEELLFFDFGKTEDNIPNMLSYVLIAFETGVRREITSSVEWEMVYSGFVQFPFYIPGRIFTNLLQNHNLSTTIGINTPRGIGIEVSLYEPLKTQLIREDYPYQGRRMEFKSELKNG
ncbi:MAG: hypothetical protein AB1797_09225 [bacterium]